MSADQNVLQGKVSENPVADRGDVDRLLSGFVLALTREHEKSAGASESVIAQVESLAAGVAGASRGES